jgi:hypothetical protein
MRNVPIHLDYKGKHLTGVADPVETNNVVRCEKDKWVLDRPADLELVEALGEYLVAWYE